MGRSGNEILSGRGDIEFHSKEQAEAYEEQKRLTAKDKRRKMIVPSTGNPEDELIAAIDAQRKIKDRASMGARELTDAESNGIPVSLDEEDLMTEGQPDEQLQRGEQYHPRNVVNPDVNLQTGPELEKPRDDLYDDGLAQKRYQSGARKSIDTQIRRMRKKGTAKK